MSSLGLDLTKNLSYFAVPAAWLLAHGTHVFAAVNAGKSYDNSCPRSFEATVRESQRLDNATKQKVLAAKGAANNGLESLGFFAAAVVAANQAGVEVRSLNTLSLGYIVLRVLYTVCYVKAAGDLKLSAVRSTLFISGIFCIVGLFVKAGLKVNQ